MFKKSFFIVIMLIGMLLLQGCGDVPSTESLNNDIENLEKKIKEASSESSKYSGGLIKTLVDARIEILKNTKAMIEQKKEGINRFIKINYTIDGKEYERPEDYKKKMGKINKKIEEIKKKISDEKKESSRYSGGLIKAMLESKIATMKNTCAFLRQKKLSLKYGIPIYISPSTNLEESEEPSRKSLEGSDLDNL